MATGRGARKAERDCRSAPGCRAGESPALSPRRVPRDDRSTSRTDGRETAAMAGSSTSRGKGRLFTPFPAVLQLLPVLQIYFRSHADIYTHFTSLLYGILRHSGLSRALFQNTSGSGILLPVQHPGPKMECQQVRFTSVNDYIPPVPLESILTRFRTYRVQNGG